MSSVISGKLSYTLLPAVPPSLLHLILSSLSCFLLYKARSHLVTDVVIFYPSSSAGLTDVCQHAELYNAALNKI